MLCLTMGPESIDLWNETSVIRVESLFLFQKEIEDIQTLVKSGAAVTLQVHKYILLLCVYADYAYLVSRGEELSQ